VSAGLEAATARTFLTTTLGADTALLALATGGVHNGSLAPQGTPYPVVLFFFMSGVDLGVVGAVRVWSDMVWTVKAVGRGPYYDDLDPIMARVDALLQRASGSVAQGTVWSVDRQTTLEYEDLVAGDPYRHLGGTYRICAS
jgi:hypothetical protein